MGLVFPGIGIAFFFSIFLNLKLFTEFDVTFLSADNKLCVFLIFDSLDEGDLTEDQLSQLILSAAQGVVLGNKLEELEEVYLDSQDEYDQLLANGLIKDNVKYMIYEEGETE